MRSDETTDVTSTQPRKHGHTLAVREEVCLTLDIISKGLTPIRLGVNAVEKEALTPWKTRG